MNNNIVSEWRIVEMEMMPSTTVVPRRIIP